MKKLISLVGLCLIVYVSIAQVNQSVLFNPHNLASATQTFPGRIGQGYNVVEVTLPSVNFSIGNNALSYNQIYKLITDPVLTDSYIETTINSFEENTNIYTALDVQLLGVHFNIKDKERNKIASFSLSITERAQASLNFPRKVFDMFYNGNSQFAGEWINFKGAVDVLAYHDIALGASIPLMIKAGPAGIKVTPGMRFRYLKGVASVNTASSSFDMFTEADGRYIQFDYDYELNTSLPEGSNIIGGNGNGFGLDVGANVKINEMITADIAVNDIGFIQFNKNNKNYVKSDEFRYEGIELNLWEADVSEWSTIDTLEKIFTTTTNSDAYRVQLQPKLSMMANITMSPMMSKKQRQYFKHNAYVGYTQGFSDVLDKTKKPIIGIGYMYSVNNVFNIGPNFTFGGQTGMAVGLHTSVKGGPFKFSIGSSDLSPLVMKNNGKGANIQTSFALSF